MVFLVSFQPLTVHVPISTPSRIRFTLALTHKGDYKRQTVQETLPVSMATRSKSSDHQVCSTNEPTSLDVLKEQNARLQTELEAERKLTKQLRREKSYDLQKTRELEQTKASIAVKDLRTKLHQERIREQELLKESLGRKYELDLQKVVRQKDAELSKLRTDLRKCQDELEETREQVTCLNKCGLSGMSARGAFENERQRLLSDIQELRTARRHLENELKMMTEAEKQRSHELQQLRGQQKVEMAKIRKEADTEVKRLVSVVMMLLGRCGHVTSH